MFLRCHIRLSVLKRPQPRNVLLIDLSKADDDVVAHLHLCVVGFCVSFICNASRPSVEKHAQLLRIV